jgi:hypothetical protein
MYDSARAMRSGWTRIFIESCGRNPRRLVFAGIELLVASVALPLAAVAAIAIGAIEAFHGVEGAVVVAASGSIALASGFALVALLHQRQRAPLAGAVLHPIAAAVVAAWLFDGARMLLCRVPVRWGGREYILTPR